MEQRSTFWRSAMTHGLYLGGALILYSVALLIVGESINKALAPINYLIMAAGIYYFQVQYRDHELGGYIRYSKALSYGVALMACASLINSLYTVILMKYIDPSLLDQIRIMQEEQLMAQGLPDDQIEMAMKLSSWFLKPVGLAISGMFGFIIIGFVVSLITSIFVKKNDDENAFNDAMSELKSEE